ncbi:SIR2 family protein [Halosolutus halophilus]|uniref:SIR2 family protein n=1 Tax=Halosolutus halophilus TaxID=1552990 RepID=UPI0022350F10|nr:SIR2 family protein [Halosolutus halophilus]
MVDKEMALTFSVRNNRGVYALLLGSGVSKAAEIPTGWGVVEDLIKKVAEIEGVEPEDPFEWYEDEFGQPARYDELIEALADTQPERRALLERYFEPTDEERENGVKTPTDAHKSIAWLMKKGYIRVVLTTNFDNLLESALRDIGVEPTVISTTEAADGAEPLAHVGPVLLKIHGDYKETNLKNTTEELSSYDEPMLALIDEVLNDYGLIICGWSGDTDQALREAILSSTDRRYSTYWTHRSEVSDLAEEIIEHRKGFRLEIEGASQFFSDLKENVRALEKAEDGAPLTRDVIRERTKQYLPRNDRRIDLSELMKEETERVYGEVFDYSALPLNEDVNDENVEQRVETYEQQVEKLVIATSISAYWENEVDNPVARDVLRAVGRLSSPPRPSSRNDAFNYLKHYPASRVFYGVGIAAVEAENWDLVQRFVNIEVPFSQISHPASLELHPTKLCAYLGRGISLNQSRLKLRLEDNLREPLQDVIPDNRRYKHAFSTFEFASDLLYVKQNGDMMGGLPDAPRAVYDEGEFEQMAERYESGGGLQALLDENIGEDVVPDLIEKFRDESTWFM